MTYAIKLTLTAQAMLYDVRDRRIMGKIRDRIDGLAYEPEKQGKALVGDLSSFRRLTALGRRYRIIYRVDREKLRVNVVGVGIRKEGDKSDIYHLARKLIRLGMTL
ncbi:MAG: type II toxin-antitoxin system RelE/ParE family toxin [Chlamydiae bacterium]|nr:type II toxin-antitoxin system RelE/ParE family toxin [Chlamydiota bacterium]MBI3276563.1 type II toxin-antitoxin system RelE/ParE family toxin [Chlamydiota bacterium]